MDNDFSKVGLYEHNAISYRKVREAYQSGEKIVGIVHATGTGKSYNALQLMHDNPEKKTIYVVPKNSISEHVQELMEENPNLDIERDFPNVEFRTYQSFVNMSEEELKNISFDLLIIDEFQHLFGPVWQQRILFLIEHNPEALVFGMTAYTVVGRGTPYERDMALPGGDELFSDKIVSRYDLVDAMIDGVLPVPIYRSSYLYLLGLEQELEEKVLTDVADKEEQKEYLLTLRDVKRRIHESSGVKKLIQNYIQMGDKCIYFCPVGSVEGINDIDTIMDEMKKIFLEYMDEEDIIFYKTTSEDNEAGKINRNAFYHDLDLDGKSVDGKLRIMFAINQYNEGVHAPNVNKVILGRATTSDMVFFEHVGRCLAVGGSYKQLYEKYLGYSWEELIKLAEKMNIRILDGMSKEDLIEKLVSPMVLDLTGNIEFIRELENNLKSRIKMRNCKKIGRKRITNIEEVSFDIDMVDQDLFLILSDLKSRLSPMSHEQRVEEYIEKLNQGYQPRYKDQNEKFSDGSYINAFWLNNKEKIKSELESNPKYREGYDIARRMIQNKEIDKIAEFIEKLNQGYRLKTHGSNEKFSDGSYINTFWDYNKEKIKNELDSNPKYIEGYEVARKIIQDKEIDKIAEFIEKLNQGYQPKYKDLKEKFSDGRYVKYFWMNNKEKIKHELDSNPKYREGYDIARRMIQDKKINKVGEFIEKLNQGYQPMGNDVNEKFSDGSYVNQFWNFSKEKIKNELDNNPKYREGYDIARRMIQNKEIDKIAEFIEKLNQGYRPKCSDSIENFSDGSLINEFWNFSKEKIKNELDNNPKYREGYDIARRMIQNKEIDKIAEFIEKLNQGYRPKCSDSIENFSDGSLVNEFWNNHRKKIKNELDSNVKYKDGYDVARETVRLCFEKIEKRANKKLVKGLCLENGIDVSKYKSFLNKSYDEVYVKLCYLKDYGIPVVDNGIIHPIFFMSDINMQVEYHVSLDDLMRQYLKVIKEKGM